MLMRLKRQHRLISASATLIALWTTLIIVRASAAAAKLRVQIGKQDATLLQLQARFGQDFQLANDIEQLNRVVNDRLSAAVDPDKALRSFAQLAEASSLQLLSAKSLSSSTHDGLLEQTFALHLNGNFNGLYAFLLAAEKVSKCAVISHLHVVQCPQHTGDITADMTVNLFSAAAGTGVTR